MLFAHCCPAFSLPRCFSQKLELFRPFSVSHILHPLGHICLSNIPPKSSQNYCSFFITSSTISSLSPLDLKVSVSLFIYNYYLSLYLVHRRNRSIPLNALYMIYLWYPPVATRIIFCNKNLIMYQSLAYHTSLSLSNIYHFTSLGSFSINLFTIQIVSHQLLNC